MIQQLYSNLSAKEKKILSIALPLVIIALFDRLFLGPIMDKTKAIEQEIVSQEAIIEQDLRLLSYKDNILKEKEIFSKYFIDTVPDDDIINNEIFKIIEELSSKNKVNLIKSTYSKIEQKKRFIEYYSNLECMGSLENIIKFMHAINSTDELLKIVRFNMNPKRGAANEIVVSVTIVRVVISPNMLNDLESADQKVS